MPISTFSGLHTSLRGLLAHQRAIDTTGHNIGNADTVGYSRQEAVLGTTPALTIPAGASVGGNAAMLGTGVDVVAYRRVRDSFLDLQYRAQNMRLGEHSTTARQLDRVEMSLAEPGETGINALMGKYWSAWADVANMPESQAARQALVEAGTVLAGAFQDLDRQIAEASAQASAEYAVLTQAGGEVDLMAREIAQLNGQISQAMAGGASPNDLMDRRDVLLDKLSAMAQVSVQELGGGSIRVSFGDAALPLVDGATVTWPQALTDASKGQLGALLSMTKPGGTLDSYRADLNTVAGQLADAVNALHAPPNFFDYTPGSQAATLAVGVTAATVRTSTTPAPGANDLALAIAAQRGAPGGAESRYRTLVNRIGSDTREAMRLEGNARALAGSVDERRMATAGVSLDEEMTNLVRFQRGYQASARAMSTIDEMLDQLINRTGRVGL